MGSTPSGIREIIMYSRWKRTDSCVHYCDFVKNIFIFIFIFCVCMCVWMRHSFGWRFPCMSWVLDNDSHCTVVPACTHTQYSFCLSVFFFLLFSGFYDIEKRCGVLSPFMAVTKTSTTSTSTTTWQFYEISIGKCFLICIWIHTVSI